jgi:hypothetical protein
MPVLQTGFYVASFDRTGRLASPVKSYSFQSQECAYSSLFWPNPREIRQFLGETRSLRTASRTRQS